MNNIYKLITAIHSFLYRLTRGRFGGKMRDFNVLLLTTKGRKSGKHHTSPLGFIEDNGNYVICGSNGGSDKHPAWYFNIQTSPNVTIEVMDKRIPAVAEVSTGEERLRLWNALVAVAPSYKDYTTKTRREIPMVVLRPVNQFPS
jgi:deazaflavin-dependent oxidoreductase (nitroreductase family)